ncbi:hypothetical protein OG381_23295 [Streptomyces sp. NBC_00490]|uniref:hypothetical protein n=1 Tax=Streptomyces sp. NBC_00490 TaxID=2903657 RepID=UPI002E18BE9A
MDDEAGRQAFRPEDPEDKNPLGQPGVHGETKTATPAVSRLFDQSKAIRTIGSILDVSVTFPQR